ncbi:MAG TPA: hypothetical protein PLA97_00180 [Rubrivivax sp.]|nr:hypothetical protein [Rubrivivax sp.]
MSLRKFAITATVLLTGALSAGGVHAGPNVQWQVTVETPTIRLPGHVVIPLPPILVPRAVVTAPPYDDRGYREPRRWDIDGDGVPNRHDRSYNPRWDRDGDGIPNRHDAYPNDPRNGRGWRGHHDGWHRHDRDDRYDDRRDWRDERRPR